MAPYGATTIYFSAWCNHLNSHCGKISKIEFSNQSRNRKILLVAMVLKTKLKEFLIYDTEFTSEIAALCSLFSDLGQHQQAATPSEVSISKVVPIHFSPMRNSTSPTLSCHNDSIMVWNDHHHKICIRWPTSSVFLPLASFYDHSLWSNSDSDTNKHTNSFISTGTSVILILLLLKKVENRNACLKFENYHLYLPTISPFWMMIELFNISTIVQCSSRIETLSK